MILSDNDILAAFDQGAIFFYSPKHPKAPASQRARLQELIGKNPNSVDVTLGETICQPEYLGSQVINPYYSDRTFEAGRFYLGHTEEFIGTTVEPYIVDRTYSGFGNYPVTIRDEYWLAPMFDTRSTLAREGVPFHLSAGFGDCGFHGRWALEIAPAQSAVVNAGDRVGQVYFQTLSSEPANKYQSNYSKVDDWSFEECVLPRKGG